MSSRAASASQARHATPMSKGVAGRLVYWVCRLGSLAVLKVFYRFRASGAERAPLTGPVVVICNHQSHIDAPAIGDTLGRTDLTFVARRGLFKNRLFGWVIRTLNAFPIDEDRGDMGAIRAALAALKEGRAVMLFPEGSRSGDGALQPFKRGAWLLMNRARCPVLPIAIEGAFDAWPRGVGFPRLFGKRIRLAVGELIPYDRLKVMDAEEGLAYLAALVDSMRLDLRRELRERSRGRYPAPGPGDTTARLRGGEAVQPTAQVPEQGIG